MLRRNQPFSAETRQSVEVQTDGQEVGVGLEQRLMMVDQQYRTNLVNKENHHLNHMYDRQKF